MGFTQLLFVQRLSPSARIFIALSQVNVAVNSTKVKDKCFAKQQCFPGVFIRNGSARAPLSTKL